MRKHTIALAGGLALLASACTDNPSAPSIDRVVAGSPQTLQTLLTGVVASDRGARGGAYYTYGDIMARDVISINPNDPRITTEMYQTQPDPSDFIGGALWTGYYVAMRAAKSLMADKSLTSLPAAQKAAADGFLQTLEGHEYIDLVDYRDVNGVVLQGADPTKQDPIVTNAKALAATVALLDSGYANLNTAGDAASVPFTLPAGYTMFGDYSNVGNLKRYNRGLAGKAEVELALLNASSPDLAAAAKAKADLDQALAGITPTAATLKEGPYYEYKPDAPDNFGTPVVSQGLMLTANYIASIDPADARKANILVDSAQKAQGYTSGKGRLAITDPNNAANLTQPLPIIRNAELYLLRAQAEIALGDLAAATADINVVHTIEGGLPPYPTATTAAEAIQDLLYEYRYSFALQGPQHLVALREYGLLDQNYVSQPGIPTPGPSSDALVQRLPIPQNEANARGGNVTPQ